MPSNEKNIIIEIETKTNKAVADIKRLNGEISKLQKQEQKFKQTTASVNQMSRSFASLATHVGRLAVIYGAFEGLTTTVRTFAEFEQSMTRLGAISGATGEELASLEEKALALGESTIYSASQVADGMNAMAMAGLSAEEQIAGIASVLNSATIGMITLEEASLLTVRTMNAFGLEAKNMGMITDVMATGATNSAQTIKQLGNAYEKVGSVATAFGHSLETTTASLMIMADAGRVGSEAGTQLKIVMSRLAGNKEAQKYIEALGISMYDANGKLLPFKDQLVLLKDKLSKLGEEARNTKLSEIFGEEGKASAIVLLKELDKLDVKVGQLKNSFGLADAKAREMQNTLIGSYKELKSALEGLAIKIGQDLSPALRAIIEDATLFIQNLDNEEIAKFGESVANILTILGDLGALFVEIAGFAGQVLASFEDLTGVSSGLAIGVAVLMVKMKGLLTVLKFFSPLSIALATAIGVVVIAFEQWEAEIARTTKATNDFIAVTDRLSKTIEHLATTDEAFTLESVQAYMEALTKGMKEAKKEIRDYEDLIKNLESGWVSDADEAQIESYKNAIGVLNGTIKNSEDMYEIMIKKGQELTDVERDQIKSKQDLANATKGLSDALTELTKDEETALAKSIESLGKREATLEKTLGNMATKERKFIADLEKLEGQLAGIREKFANEREALVLSTESRIADLKVKGLSDIVQYNDAQKRADVQLAKAKEAIASGNLDMAKKYLAEYDTLIALSAGEEISHTKKVMVWDAKSKKYKEESIKVVDALRQTTLAEAIKDEQAGSAVKLELLAREEAKAVEAHNAKIQQKIVEMQMLKAQMTIQQQMLNQIGEMIAKAQGVEFKADLTAFNSAMTIADQQIEALMGQQREIKITGDISGIEQDVDQLDSDLEREPLKTDLEVDTQVGFTQFKKFKNDAEKTPLELNSEVDLVKPKNDVKAFKHEVESQSITAPVTSDTSQAIRNDGIMRQQLSRPLPTLTQYIQQVIIPARKHGGLIFETPKLPKFADGGHLENGVGHARKSGKLGGYGGGDKVKALLEAGEFIIRKEAVRALGLDRLHTLNQGLMPKYQQGGLVNPIQKFSTGGLTQKSVTTQGGKTVDLNFNIGGNTYNTVTSESVANALAEYLQRNEF